MRRLKCTGAGSQRKHVKIPEKSQTSVGFGVLKSYSSAILINNQQSQVNSQIIKEGGRLDDIPKLLERTAELAARDARAQRVLGYRDLLVDHMVCEIVAAAGHGAYEYAEALVLRERGEVPR